MLKRIIARILVVALLVQCLPAQALADAGDSMLISQQELDRLAAEYTLTPEGDDGYYNGMGYSENFTILQLIGYLTYLKEHEIDPLAVTVEMLVSAVAKFKDAGPQQEKELKDEREWLQTLDAYMFILHDTTDDITACLDGLDTALSCIKEGAQDVWNKEDYSFTTRLGYSMRVRKAEQDIAKIRNTVTEKQKDWENTLRNLEQAIRYDGTVDMQVTPIAANGDDGNRYEVEFEPRNDELGTVRIHSLYEVEFKPRNDELQDGQGTVQIRNLYKQLRPTGDDSRKLYTVSAQTMGLNRAPSLLERLSPVSSAYADDREQDASVTVIDDNQFALEVRDVNTDEPIAGMVVRAIDADKMYTEKTPQFVEATTDTNGAAVFDIPGNFTFNEFDKLELYIEYPSGTGKIVEGKSANSEGYKAARLWNVSVARGSTFAFETKQTTEPYIVSASFDWVDITNTVGEYFRSDYSQAVHFLYVEMANADPDGTLQLVYTDASAVKDKDGKYPTTTTEKVNLQEANAGTRAVTLEGKFLHDFKAGESVTLVYEDARHGTMELPVNLKISESKGTPYKGNMKFLDMSTSSLLNINVSPISAKWAGINIGIDNPFNVPEVSVNFANDGNLFIQLGADTPDAFLHGRYTGWPFSIANEKYYPEMVAAQAAKGPQRATQEDAEHASRAKTKDVDVFINKKGQAVVDNLEAATTKGSMKDPARKTKLGHFLNGSIDASIFGFASGHLEQQGEGANGTIGTFEGQIGIGLRFAFGTEWTWDWTWGFLGVSASASVSFALSLSSTEDVVWRTWSDYDVTSPNLFQSAWDMKFTIYLKLSLDIYFGIGMRGVLEFSLHGFAYFAFTWTWTFFKQNSKYSGEAGKPEPHIVISWGGGLYALFKFVLLRIRVECLPKTLEKDEILSDNWSTSATRQTSAPAPTANADDEDKDGTEQTVSGDPPVYNSDIVVDIDNPNPDGPLHFKQLAESVEVEAKGGKVVYARISGGKYKNTVERNTTAGDVHTYAFFITTCCDTSDLDNKMNGKPRLSYIDLDAPNPTVFTFDEEPYPDNPITWSNSETNLRNKAEEDKDTRKYEGLAEPYDYDFAVASVKDSNWVDKNGNAPRNGMSAVVCVLSCAGFTEEQETNEATGDTMTVEQPSGDFFATTFVATRVDETTGRLSMVTSHSKAPYKIENDDVTVTCSMQISDDLWSGYGTAKDFRNPQITAAFTNATFGPGETGKQFNANVYEAVVTFQPPDKNREDSDAGWVLRYRTFAGDYYAMIVTANDIYPLDDKGLTLAQDRMHQVVLDRMDLPTDYMVKKDSNKQNVSVGDGLTKTFSVIPFNIDTSGFKDMWKTSKDYGPQVNWLETRGFANKEKPSQFYHFYETQKGDDMQTDGFEGWEKGFVDWMPLSPADGSKLIGREGVGVSGHITPWNADPADNVAFFFFTDDEGRSYLDSVNLSNGLMTDYGFTAPAADMGCVDTEQSIVFYWFSSHAPIDPEDSEDGANFSLNTMIYEKESGVLFSPVVAAYIKTTGKETPIEAKDEKTPVKPFVTETGACYFAVEEAPSATASGVRETDGTTSYTFYRFDQKYAMGVEFLAASFADGAVRQGAYDDINLRLRNNGNTPISGFTMEVYDVVEEADGTETENLMETVVADLADPTKSSVTYSGLADGSKRTETGADVISVAGVSMFRTRGEWAVMEATPFPYTPFPYGEEATGDNPDALPTGWTTESTYVTTNSLLPGDQTTLTAPILIGANWKGSHTIRFRITQIVSSNQWAVDLEDWKVTDGNAVHSTHTPKNPAPQGAKQQQAAVSRMPNGKVALHYAGTEPKLRETSVFEKLFVGSRSASEDYVTPDGLENYVTPTELDMMDLDTSIEDVTLSAHPYVTTDGTQMVQLTAHNNAHEDSEPKCVLLYAYADYDYENPWLVYDFGDLNAGTSMTLSLPLDLILQGKDEEEMQELHLDLHIDHEEARREGVLLNLETQPHTHSENSLLNACRHDRMALDDVVTLPMRGAKPLEIIQQPTDVYTVTGDEVSFSVTVMGGRQPYTYRWQVRKPLLDKDGKHLLDEHGNWRYSDWEDWPGGTGNTLNLTATPEMNGWQFHVIVDDSNSNNESVSSNFARLWLTDVPVTGDKAQPALWLLLACAALVTALATALITAKKRKRQDKAR